jgi:hypothetical protein
MQTKLQFFRHDLQLYCKFKREKKQVAMKITGYGKLYVTLMSCMTANGSKFPPSVLVLAPKKCMNDKVNRRLGWMCMGM